MADAIVKKGRKPAVEKMADAPVQFGVPSADAATVQDGVEALPSATAPVAAVTEIEVPEVVLPPVNMKEETMTNETINTAAAAATQAAEGARGAATAMFGDMTGRAKDAMAKGQAAFGDAAEFNKGNVEALVSAARIAAKGWQDIAAYSVDYGRSAIATANENTRRLAGVKSPTEFFQVGSEIAKANLDETVAQVSKFSESYLKRVGEVVQPIANRYALAADKVKSAYAA